MGVRGDFYNVILVLHLMAVIAGFGPTLLAGVFGAKAKARGGIQGQAIAETQFEVLGTWCQWFIYSVPITGILLVLLSEDVWKFSQAWISFSFLLYIVALGISHAIHIPNIRRMNELMAELTAGPAGGGGGQGGPPPQVAELEQRGKRAAALGGLLNLILVILIALMIWKPGVEPLPAGRSAHASL